MSESQTVWAFGHAGWRWGVKTVDNGHGERKYTYFIQILRDPKSKVSLLYHLRCHPMRHKQIWHSQCPE